MTHEGCRQYAWYCSKTPRWTTTTTNYHAYWPTMRARFLCVWNSGAWNIWHLTGVCGPPLIGAQTCTLMDNIIIPLLYKLKGGEILYFLISPPLRVDSVAALAAPRGDPRVGPYNGWWRGGSISTRRPSSHGIPPPGLCNQWFDIQPQLFQIYSNKRTWGLLPLF
jgi:hypothetical protein